jgi:hypothetical protein
MFYIAMNNSANHASAHRCTACSKPGKYVLASGAGPFTINPDCGAVHCELFGGFFDYTNTSSPITGNNYLDGHELDAAVMAVIDVSILQSVVLLQANCILEQRCSWSLSCSNVYETSAKYVGKCAGNCKGCTELVQSMPS